MKRSLAPVLCVSVLASCAAPETFDGPSAPPVPAEVLALAAPFQNLAEIEFRAEDGC